MNKAAICALAMIGATQARYGEGSCPEGVTFQDDFDVSRFVGKWYQVEGDIQNKWTRDAACVTQEYAFNADGNVDLYYRGKYEAGYRGINGTIYNCDTGNCEATMGSWTDRRFPFRTFATDYENYHISYNCYERNGKFTEFLSVNARQAAMSPRLDALVSGIIAERLPWFVDYMK